MSISTAISTSFDFLLVALLIYGFINEDKLIEFEMKIKRKIYRAIRKYLEQNIKKKG